MQTKWLEDFIALAAMRSFTRAAEARHVTHPAFGRRIRALEQWAGVRLVDRDVSPVELTPAGERLLAHAQQAVSGFDQLRDGLRGIAGVGDDPIRIGTGRTLAHTLATGLLRPLFRDAPGRARLQRIARGAGAGQPGSGHGGQPLPPARVRLLTGSMAETLLRLERGEIDFMLSYHHTLLAIRLSPRQYLQRVVAQDRLVPMSLTQAGRQPRWRFQARAPVPYLAYANTLALGRLVEDHLAHHDDAPWLRPVLEADSADALRSYVLAGFGVAWMPWSMMAGAHRNGEVAILGGKSLEIGFEVRLVRPKRRLTALAEAFWSGTDGG